MKHSKQLFYSLITILFLCPVITIADKYEHPHVHMNTSLPGPKNSNITLTAPTRPAPVTKSNHRTPTPPQQQMTVVMGWMQQLYPANAQTVPPQQAVVQTSQPTSMSLSPEIPKQQTLKQTNNTTHTPELIKNDNQAHATQHYILSEKMYGYCDAHAININALEHCQGDIIQQTIHNKFIDITKTTASLWYSNKFSKHDKNIGIIADFTDAGLVFNHAGNTDKATALAEACWMLLNCISAAGEGVVEGAHNIVDDIIHPIRTAQNILDSAATCGYYMGKVAIEIGELGYLVLSEHPDETYKKMETWTNNFTIIYKAIKEKRATLKTRDIIKEATSFDTQCYATSKALHGVGTLFKQASKVAKKTYHANKTTALTTPEGIIVKIADNAVEYMKSAQEVVTRTFLKAANMSEFFELPLGKALIKNSQKMPERFQHSPIYKITKDIPGTDLKKGYFYYLDRFHKDHIEVFDHAYKCINVYNLDGTPNLTKHIMAQKNGRNIRNLMKGKQ
jgi:hypothetical protein